MDVPRMMDDRIYISAKADDSLDTLIDLIEKKLSESEAEYELILPYSEGAILSSFNERGIVKSTEYLPEGIKIVATLSASDATKYQEFFSCNLG
jgi:GTP-binding protein HflX